MIREIHKDEVMLLKDFLYEAIYIPEGVTSPPRSILDQPELFPCIRSTVEKVLAHR